MSIKDTYELVGDDDSEDGCQLDDEHDHSLYTADDRVAKRRETAEWEFSRDTETDS